MAVVNRKILIRRMTLQCLRFLGGAGGSLSRDSGKARKGWLDFEICRCMIYGHLLPSLAISFAKHFNLSDRWFSIDTRPCKPNRDRLPWGLSPVRYDGLS